MQKKFPLLYNCLNLHLHGRGSLFGQCVFLHLHKQMHELRCNCIFAHTKNSSLQPQPSEKNTACKTLKWAKDVQKNLYICTPNHSLSSLIRLGWFLFAYLNQSPTWPWLGICSGLRRAKGACMCVFLILLLCVSCESKVSTDNDEGRRKAGKNSTGQGCRNTVEEWMRSSERKLTPFFFSFFIIFVHPKMCWVWLMLCETVVFPKGNAFKEKVQLQIQESPLHLYFQDLLN